ncbi:MAG: hypothetical protein M5U22_10740 [Thermoleophilia bacterium]|nr:hypothetical protein [Thermoleophilia bacterium]
MAKKETRRAYRQAQQQPKVRGPRRPTIKRSAIQGAILAALYLILVRLVLKGGGRPVWVDLLWTFIFFFFYATFIYFWESFLFNRRQRRQSGKK